MTVFIIRRLLQALVVVVIMSLIVFFGVSVIGDPLDSLVSSEATPEEVEAIREAFGLNKPIYIQYFYFVGGILEGNFGESFIFGRPAIQLILHHMPATIELAVVSLVMSIALGIPLGLYAGLFPEQAISRGIMAGSILGFSLPTFWVGLMMIMLFAVWLGWLPSTGRGDTAVFLGIESSMWTRDGLSHLFMPALNLALTNISLVIRLTRAGVREAMHQDYIKFARAKGLSTSRVIGVHLLKNIMIPVVTVLGLEFGNLLAFSVVTETIFAWPGMGKLLIDSLLQLDRPVVVAYLMIIVAMFVVINLVVDIAYSVLDPRVRLKDQGT
ncbi:MAG: ABC transporter permease [Pseudomonadota bacterium]